MLGTAMTSVGPTGRYVTYQEKMEGLMFATCINLSKKHPDNIQSCRFDGTSSRVILNDRQGNLVRVGVEDTTYSQVTKAHITHFYCHNENVERILAVEWCKGQSRLLSINHVSKKQDHVTNLNMNKIVSFSVNCIRDLILAMDSGLLALVDIKTKKQYKSLKSSNQKFMHACFSADNKNVLLINNTMKLSVINIADMKTKWSTVLPMQFERAKIHPSYDNHWIIITGNFPGMYLLELSPDRAPIPSKIELPTPVKYAKFTLKGDFVFVGRDQIVYLFSIANNPDKIYQLYNTEQQKPINCFDISVDLRYLVAVSNYGNIFLFSFRQTLRKLKQKPGNFKETPIFWINDTVAKEIDYNPLDKSFEVEPNERNGDEEGEPPVIIIGSATAAGTLKDKSTHNQFQDFDNIPHLDISHSYEQAQNEVLPIPSDIQQKKELTEAFYKLKKCVNKDRFFEEYTNEVIQILYAFHRMFSARKANSISGFFLSWIITLRPRVRELSLVICPDLFTIMTRKLEMDFVEFTTQSMASLYLDYFNKDDWLRIIRFFIHNANKPAILLVFFLRTLKELQPLIEKCEYEADLFEMLTSEKNLDIAILMQQSINLYDIPKYQLVLGLKEEQPTEYFPPEQEKSEPRPQQYKSDIAVYSEQSEDPAQKNARMAVEGLGLSKLQQLLRNNEKLKGKLQSIANVKYNLVNTFN